MLQDDNLHLLRKAGFVEGDFARLDSPDVCLVFQEVLDGCDRKTTFLGFEVHGNKDFRLNLFCHPGCFLGVDGEKTAHGNQENVGRADLSQFLIAQQMAQVSEVTELNTIDIDREDGVGTSFAAF